MCLGKKAKILRIMFSALLILTVLLLSSCDTHGGDTEKDKCINSARRAVIIELGNTDFTMCRRSEFKVSVNEDRTYKVSGYVDCRDERGNTERRHFYVIVLMDTFESDMVVWG